MCAHLHNILNNKIFNNLNIYYASVYKYPKITLNNLFSSDIIDEKFTLRKATYCMSLLYVYAGVYTVTLTVNACLVVNMYPVKLM